MKLPNEVVNKIVELYSDGLSSVAIGRQLGIPFWTIINCLENRGIKRRTWRKIPVEEETKISELYLQGKTIKEIAELYNVGNTTIKRYLDKYSVPMRTSGESQRVYKCDHNFFASIDTEAKAYFLGFIFADGCVTNMKRRKVLSISIKKSDISLLETFRRAVKSNHPIKENKDGTVRIHICSPEIVNDLSKYGCVQNKTFKITFPSIPKPMQRHFIRGYFDGDGSLTISKCRGKTVYRVMFAGNANFLTDLQRVLQDNLSIKPVALTKHKSIYVLSYVSDAKAILDWLYKDATVYLERKHQRYRLICQVEGGKVDASLCI